MTQQNTTTLIVPDHLVPDHRQSLHQSNYYLVIPQTIGGFLFTALFAWSAVQETPGMIPDRLGSKVARVIQIALLVSICLMFLWMMAGMLKQKNNMTKQEGQATTCKSLTLGLCGLSFAFIGVVIILPEVIFSTFDPKNIGELIAPMLFLIAILFLAYARNLPHRNRYLKSNEQQNNTNSTVNKHTSIKRFISVGTFLLLMQLIGVGAFIGKGLLDSNLGGKVRYSVTLHWAFTAMLITAAIASLCLFIKDIIKECMPGLTQSSDNSPNFTM